MNEDITIISELPQGKYEIDGVFFDKELRIKLNNGELDIILSFGTRIIYFKYTEEEVNFSRVQMLCHVIGDKIKTNSIFVVKKSKLIMEIIEKSAAFYEADTLFHYMIVGLNHIVDIISMDNILTKNT